MIVVMLENMNANDLSTLLGSNVATLESQCITVSDASGITHTSLPNYVDMLTAETPTTSSLQSCLENSSLPTNVNCLDPNPNVFSQATSGTTSSDGVAREYVEGQAQALLDNSTVCADDNSPTGNVHYVAHHNPVAYFPKSPGVSNCPNAATADVDFGNTATDTGNFYTDLSKNPGLAKNSGNSAGPDFMLVIPNTFDDGSKCTGVGSDPSYCNAAGAFVTNLVNYVNTNTSTDYYQHTAIVITSDEGSGGTGGNNHGLDCVTNYSYYEPYSVSSTPGSCNVPFLVVSQNSHAGVVTTMPSTSAPYGEDALDVTLQALFGESIPTRTDLGVPLPTLFASAFHLTNAFS